MISLNMKSEWNLFVKINRLTAMFAFVISKVVLSIINMLR